MCAGLDALAQTFTRQLFGDETAADVFLAQAESKASTGGRDPGDPVLHLLSPSRYGWLSLGFQSGIGAVASYAIPFG
jgi:hypothetical protein